MLKLLVQELIQSYVVIFLPSEPRLKLIRQLVGQGLAFQRYLVLRKIRSEDQWLVRHFFFLYLGQKAEKLLLLLAHGLRILLPRFSQTVFEDVVTETHDLKFK